MVKVSLIFLVTALSYACTCQSELKDIFDIHLRELNKSYEVDGTGHDFFEPPSSCRAKNFTHYSVIYTEIITIKVSFFGFCTPKCCSEEELYGIVQNLKIPDLFSNSGGIKTFSLEENEVLNLEGKFFLGCFTCLAALTIYSTIFSGKKANFVECFNIVKNFKAFLNLDGKYGRFEFFNGIRSICSFFLVILHHFVFFNFLPLSNRKDIIKFTPTFWIEIIFFLTYAVDIFFFISGFLMSHLTINEYKNKKENFNAFRCLSRRLIRLFPVYFFLFGFDSIKPMSFPNIIQSIPGVVLSEEPYMYRWRSYFLINYIYKSEVIPYLVWSWTVAVDFALYAITLGIVYMYLKNKSYGFVSALIAILFNIFNNFYVSQINSYSTSALDNFFSSYQSPTLYFNPLSRISSFVLGIAGAFILDTTLNDVKIQSKSSLLTKISSFNLSLISSKHFSTVISTLFVFSCIYVTVVPYFITYYCTSEAYQFIKSIWLASNRIILILPLLLMTLAMSLGKLNRLSKFLSSRTFRFFAKISYCIYLFHVIVFFMVHIRNDDYYQVSILFCIREGLIVFFFSTIASVFIHIVIEMPFLGIEKHYLAR